MDRSLLKLIGRKFGFIILIDILVFIFLITVVVNNYKLFSLLLTCCIISVLTYFSINYFIHLSYLSSTNDDHADNRYSINKKIACFLFRNEYFFKFLKILVKRKFFKHEIGILLNSNDQNSNVFQNDLNFNKEEKNIDDLNQFKNELNINLERFLKKFSIHFLETWYKPYVSDDPEFLKDVQIQLKYIFNDFFVRLNNIHKLSLFSCYINLFNENFINMAIKYNLNNEKFSLDQLHPALRNSPASEIIYNKKIVQIILRKSASNFNINHPLIEELFMQIIGKNCIESLINLMTKPNFLYYAICLMISKKKTHEIFSIRNDINQKEIDDKQTELKEEILTTSTALANLVENDETNQLVSNRIVTSSPNLNDNLIQLRSPGDNFMQIISLKISSTETGQENGSGKEYTIYNIEFEFKLNKNDDLVNEIKLKKMIQHRFKEFVTLQKLIEDNPSFKPYIRNIRGPSKIVNLPIGNMTEEYVEKRRKKLDKYLNDLVQIPIICNSKELINFLCLNEYLLIEDDKSSFYSNDSSIIKTFSGVFDKLSYNRNNSRKHEDSTSSAPESIFFEYMNKEADEKIMKSTILKSISPSENLASDNIQLNNIFTNKEKQNNIHFSKNLFEVINKALAASSDLSHLPKHFWFNNQNVHQLIESCVCDYYAEKFFDEIFSHVLSTKNLIEYINDIEYILFDRNSNNKINFDSNNDKFYQVAQQLINDLIPDIFKSVLHKKRYEFTVKLLLDSLSNDLLNRHFMYCLIDTTLCLLYNENID